MATIAQLPDGSRLYLDANVLIYLIEGADRFKTAVSVMLEEAADRRCSLATSEISITECLYGAFRRRDEELVRDYKNLFRDRDFVSLVPVTADLLEQAAQLGALYRIKTLDAIHVASAVSVQCDAIFSNDRAIRAPAAIKVVSLELAR